MFEHSKKLVFDEEGKVSQTIDGFIPPLVVDVTIKSNSKKGSRIEKRSNLRAKRIGIEKEYFEKQFGHLKENGSVAETIVLAEPTIDEPVSQNVEEIEKVEISNIGRISKPKQETPTKALKSQSLALSYLENYTNNPDTWKFQKVRQTWILQNLYYLHQISNDHFKMCLGYIRGMGDKAKEATISEARGMIDGEVTDTIKKRAKKIIKLL